MKNKIKKESYNFKSEVKNLLHLMIHSLYSNKEIFLRELISNASDASEKLRFQAITKPDLYENDSILRIRLSYNKDERTITLDDNGIGMSRSEVINNLGTIAQSGTKDFLKNFNSNNVKDANMIGQFGVGFYSSFIVSDKVTVFTRLAGEDINKGVCWESTGEGDYTVKYITKKYRGTKIVLHIRENANEFLDDWKLKNIIKKYSDHIELPVELLVNTKKDKKNVLTWEQINKAKALWTRKKSDISLEEYKEFYKHISHDNNDPLTWIHNHVEGTQEYINLIYIPQKTSWDIWNREYKHGLKLYINRIFIMDDAEQFLPNYLRFAKGIIDSNDLPLNISRELLQDSVITNTLKNAITKKILTQLENLAKNNSKNYQIFWKSFSLIFKEGPAEDIKNRHTISKLLRFSSTHCNNSNQIVSLDEYCKRMIKNQDKIFFLTSDSYISAKNSPHLEVFKKNNIEVLLLSDRIDEWMMGYLTDFNGKLFQSVSKSDTSSFDNLIKNNLKEKEKKDIKQNLNSLVQRVKSYLSNRVKDVKITYRLTDTPAIVTTDNNDMTTQMAKLFSATGQSTPEIKYIFELNPEHILVKKINDIHEDNIFNKWIDLLLDQALLIEKGSLEDPNKFIKCINDLLSI
ncbi:MAG: molecular chaperone HtpG [Enterobacterales bacterium]